MAPRHLVTRFPLSRHVFRPSPYQYFLMAPLQWTGAGCEAYRRPINSGAEVASFPGATGENMRGVVTSAVITAMRMVPGWASTLRSGTAVGFVDSKAMATFTIAVPMQQRPTSLDLGSSLITSSRVALRVRAVWHSGNLSAVTALAF